MPRPPRAADDEVASHRVRAGGDRGAGLPRARAAGRPRDLAPVPVPGPGDGGVSTVEWVAGLLIVAGMVTAMVTLTVPQSVRDGVEAAICEVFSAGGSGDCQTPQEQARDEDFRPDVCTTASSTWRGDVWASVLIFKVGEDLTFMQSTDSDGNVTVTAVNGQSGGVEIVAGGEIQAGGSSPGGSASTGASLRIAAGDGWVFESQDEADEFIDDIRRRAVAEAIVPGPTGLGGFVVGGLETIGDAVGAEGIVDDVLGDVPDPDIHQQELEISANGALGAALGGPRLDRQIEDGRPEVGIDPNTARAYVNVDASAKVIRTQNDEENTTSTTFQLRGGARAGADAVGIDQQEARASAQGAVTLTEGPDGELQSLTLTQTTIINDRSTVTTTELPVDTEAERDIVRDYLTDPGNAGPLGPTLQLTWDDMAPTRDPGPDASPLQRLLYEQGQTQRVNYSYDSHNTPFGARAGEGVQVGAGFNVLSSDQEVTDAEYLGAPGANGTRPFRDFTECR